MSTDEQRFSLEYEPTERQVKLHMSTARIILYGGAAGGGKSHGMRWDAYKACLDNPGCDAYLFRRTRVELENTHIKRVVQELHHPQERLGRYNYTRNRWEFPNGSFLNMCYAEHEQDVMKYNSVEFHWLGVDEAGHFTPQQLSYLKSRMRTGSWRPRQKNLFPRLIMSANPGGISHNHLREKYIKAAPPETLFHDPDMADPNDPTDPGWSCIFIPAKIQDNPHLDKSYAGAFGGLPEWQQQMLRDGDWDVVPGAFFDCFNRRKHVIPYFMPPANWLRFRSLDWGHATPFSVGWWAISDGESVMTRHGEITLPEGAMVRYREWYGSSGGNKGLRLDGVVVADRILEYEKPDREIKARISYGVADPQAWRTESGPSTAEKMIRKGVPWRRADNKREAGWQEMYNRMVGYEQPMLYVMDNCRHFIEQIPVLEADPMNPEDILKKGEDHIGDETRYACMSRPYMAKKVADTTPVFRNPTFNELRQELERKGRKKKRITYG